MRFVLLLCLLSLAATLMVACAPVGSESLSYKSGKGSVTPDGLHQVGTWEPFRSTYVKPGADLQRYSKVLVENVTVSYKTPPRPGAASMNAMESNYALPASAIASIKKFFHEVFTQELAKSQSFTVVEAPGPDVLLIRAHLLDLEISVPPERDQQAMEDVYTASPGAMTLLLDARDSKSGEPLVRVAQRRAIQMPDDGWYQSNPTTNSSAVRSLFRSWATALRGELDRFHALPALPPIPSETPPE